MELKFLIFLSVVLPFINCVKNKPSNFKHEVEGLEKYYAGTEIVKGILKLSKNGFLGEGGTGFVYAGKFIEKDLSEVSVAIKFYPGIISSIAQNVIKISKKLGANEKPQIEGKGFPNVYYHGNWESYYLIAMTKLDYSLADIQGQEKKLNIEIIHPLDMLILFKNFVILSEKMHTSGVIHGNVHPGNIMFRAKQCFLIDFDISKEMEKMGEKEKFEKTHKDWKEFIFMIIDHYESLHLETSVACQNALQNLKLNKKLDEGLQSVMEEFAKEAFSTVSSKVLPDYDHLKKVIDKVIKKEHPNSGSNPTFSWLYIIRDTKTLIKKTQKFAKEVKEIDEFVYRDGQKNVNNILILNENGFLGEGATGFVYGGKFVEEDLSEFPVAIKFYPQKSLDKAKNVMKIFEKVNPNYGEEIENKGFPNVYYRCEWSFYRDRAWKPYYLIAMTKLDYSLADIQGQEKKLNIEIIHPLDILILFKQFVILSEKMHTSGVSHGNIHPGNIMFRAKQCFLIDFDTSKIMERTEKFMLTHEDWKQFIYMITRHYDEKCNLANLVAYQNAIENLELHGKLDEGLQSVMEKFAEEAFQKYVFRELPDYGKLTKFIDKVIKEKHPNSGSNPTFSWLQRIETKYVIDENV